LGTLGQARHQYQRVDHPVGIHQLRELILQKAHQEREPIPLKHTAAEVAVLIQLARVPEVMAVLAVVEAETTALVRLVMEIHLLHLHHKEITVEPVVLRRGILVGLAAVAQEAAVQMLQGR
jgi:hypothetical protein